MVMAPGKRGGAPSTAANLSLVHLKNCLVNLPSSLVNLLVNINAPAQNVIVELKYRLPSKGSSGPGSGASSQNSVYLGWTGMPSKRKLSPFAGRDGVNGRDHEVASLELDATLAATLDLSDGQRVMAYIHVDPPLAHTVNIEPLTAEDWEMIELHATFLELNMQHQIRALPNPTYMVAEREPANPHPLTLHFSPTSTANIRVLSIEPAVPGDAPFVKIAPDAEVIVAPKTRTKNAKAGRENRSVTSTSKKSGKTSSTTRRRSAREEKKQALFLRGLDRKFANDWLDEDPGPQDFSVWIDRDLLLSQDFRGLSYVCVSVVKPAGLQAPIDPHKQQEATATVEGIKASQELVARLRPWDDTPSGQTVALSSPLCAALGCTNIVGGIIKVKPAPPPVSRSIVKRLKIHPFDTDSTSSSEGLRFGGESRAEKEAAAKMISHMYAGKESAKGLLAGPLTDGMVLPTYDGLDFPSTWSGGILKLDLEPPPAIVSSKEPLSWCLGSDRQFPLEAQALAPPPLWLEEGEHQEEHAYLAGRNLVGIDSLFAELRSHLSHLSSVLLTGALGSGKNTVAQALASTLKGDLLFHTTYFPCRQLVNDESRISTIRGTLNRVFMRAGWGARLGGKSLVILDDLDKLCPVETELQVGNDNSRSRQISEAVCSIVWQYCGRSSEVVLLATAQGKDSLHNAMIAGHVVREIVDLKAPDKEARRRIMESSVMQHTALKSEPDYGAISDGSRPTTADGSHGDEEGGAWMDGADRPRRPNSASGMNSDGFVLDPDLDFLDIAGETDGYMPRDILLLVSRARNEALMRSVSDSTSTESLDLIQLGRVDFNNALKGFTPASLQNVTLQTSTITFDSIGGLKETCRVLMETLQYPTKYAPIFAQCPLRLRSGLLLYGFPGCGKTLLASAVAGECGLNFISVKGPEILNKYIGASEKSVRDLFERASAAKPCVLFFDEFDSIAPKRGHDSTGVTDRVVNQLLTQMDGAEGLSGVYVLAATSRPDLIDPALLRPGRLDKSLLCGFPSFEDRIDILRALGNNVKLSNDILSGDGLAEVARRTEGFSGADLQALVSNAQLEAIHDVLKDSELQSSGTKRSTASRDKSSLTARPRNFAQFRYGVEASHAEAEEGAKKGHNRSSDLAANAAIVAKLQEIKLARKRAKLAQKGPAASTEETSGKGEENKDTEVVIEWNHLMKALGDTRASISPQERSRLERIYREFVVGRSGEMKDGQASMEVGGRSSLM